MSDTKTVEQYADDIMVMVEADSADRPEFAVAFTFADLNEHVDANAYLIRAGVPWDLEDDELCKLNGAVQAEVERRLAARPSTLEATRDKYDDYVPGIDY